MLSLYLLPEMRLRRHNIASLLPAVATRAARYFRFQAFFMSQIYAGGIPINGMTNSELLPKQPRGRLSVDEGHP
jgi:hypothetical protein